MSDTFVDRIKKHKAVAAIVLIASFVTGLAVFTDSLQDLYTKYDTWANTGLQKEIKPLIEGDSLEFNGAEIVQTTEDSLTEEITPTVETMGVTLQNNVPNEALEGLSKAEKMARDFEVFCHSQIRISEASAPPSYKKDGVEISLRTTSYCDNGMNRPCEVLYHVNQRNNLLEINPSSEYLKQLSKGKLPTYLYNSYSFGFPSLDILVTNNSDKTITFSNVLAEIKKSVPDKSPYLVQTATSGYFNLPIKSIGYGPAGNAKVELSFADSTGKKYVHVLDLGNISSSCDSCSLKSLFEQYGVDVNLITAFYGDESEFPSDQEMQIARGMFNTSQLPLKGKLLYSGLNANGVNQDYALPFTYILDLNPSVKVSAGIGLEQSFYNLKFEIDETDYKRSMNLTETCKPGESVQFQINMLADASSKHLFDLTLNYQGGDHIKMEGFALNFHSTNNLDKWWEREENLTATH